MHLHCRTGRSGCPNNGVAPVVNEGNGAGIPQRLACLACPSGLKELAAAMASLLCAWFSVDLSRSTNENIEARICAS